MSRVSSGEPRCGAISRVHVLIFAALAAAALLSAIYLDHPLAQHLDAQPRDAYWWFFRYISYLGEGRYWALVGLLGIAAPLLQRRCSRLRLDALHAYRAGIVMLLALASSAITVHAVKFAVGRARPRTFLTTGFEEFHPFSLRSASFPSGHSQTIWAAMMVLALFYPRRRTACLVFAVLVCASRLVLVKHYPSDVIIGAWIGAIWALAFARSRYTRLPLPHRWR